jgi:hypothetical protein
MDANNNNSNDNARWGPKAHTALLAAVLPAWDHMHNEFNKAIVECHFLLSIREGSSSRSSTTLPTTSSGLPEFETHRLGYREKDNMADTTSVCVERSASSPRG